MRRISKADFIKCFQVGLAIGFTVREICYQLPNDFLTSFIRYKLHQDEIERYSDYNGLFREMFDF